MKTPLNKIPLLGSNKIPLLGFKSIQQVNTRYKMSEIVNKFLLGGDIFMPEIHLRQPGFTHSACGPFTKNKERMKKFKETGDSKYINQNKLDNACFQHEIAYGDFKDLARKSFADKVLCSNTFNIPKDLKYDGYHRRPASMVYNVFDKKTSGSGIKNVSISNKGLAEELHKQVIRKFKKRKVQSPFIENIWVQI